MTIKEWLEQAGEPVARTAFTPADAPRLPFIVFLDTEEVEGADHVNGIVRHSLIVERYSEDGEPNPALDELFLAGSPFEDKALHWSYDQEWVSSDEMFEEIYTFETDIIERR